MPRSIARAYVVPAALLLALGGACSSAAPLATLPTPTAVPPSASTPTATPTAAGATASAGATATAAASSSSSPTTGPASSASGGQPQVHLVFAGAYSFTADGSFGTCPLGYDANHNPIYFGFQATEADYSGLGQILAITESKFAATGNPDLSVKWIVDGSHGYIDSPPKNWSTSPDHNSLQLDTRMSGGAEHISGSITCP